MAEGVASSSAGHSGETARDNLEEGGDDAVRYGKREKEGKLW